MSYSDAGFKFTEINWLETLLWPFLLYNSVLVIYIEVIQES